MKADILERGENQAVRLPKEFRFTGDEVFIKRMGSAFVLLPKSKRWGTLIAAHALVLDVVLATHNSQEFS